MRKILVKPSNFSSPSCTMSTVPIHILIASIYTADETNIINSQIADHITSIIVISIAILLVVSPPKPPTKEAHLLTEKYRAYYEVSYKESQ